MIIKRIIKISALIVAIFFLTVIIYHFKERREILSIYAQMNKNISPPTRLLPSKDHQEYIRILSIDGGSIRGIIPMHILKYIEKKTNKPTAELFDFMMGTSTGGIAISGLTTPDENLKPRYSADDILHFYNMDAKFIFKNPWYHNLLTLDGLLGPKYMPGPGYATFRKYFGDITFDELINNVAIPAYDIYDKSPIVFCNWMNPITRNANMQVASLLMGAIAVPGIFPSVVFNSEGKSLALADGGLYSNNPALTALLLAVTNYPDKKYILVSLGTGEIDRLTPTEEIVDWGMVHWFKNILPLMLDSESKLNNYLMEETSIVPLNYFRFNTRFDASAPAWDDMSDEVMEELNEIGQELVDQNQAKLDELVEMLLHP